MSDAMRDDGFFDDTDTWHPPTLFRDGLADTERLAALLLEQLAAEESLLVPVARIEFLARRVHQLARHSHAALPPEVV